MLLDPNGVVALLQMVLGPFMTAGQQAVAQPANLAPMRQPPWLPPGVLQPLYVPPSVAQALVTASRAPQPPNYPNYYPNYYYPSYQSPEPQPGAGAPGSGSVAPTLLEALQQQSQAQGLSEDTAHPMPMATLLSMISNLLSGFRVMSMNFLTSFAAMGIVRLLPIVLQNLPIILGVLGLTRSSMARVIAEGVTRAQCLERAACVLGKHAHSYPATPGVLRWLRSPDGSTTEHPVWEAFRSTAEGYDMPCDSFIC